MKISPELLRLVPYQAGKPISETKREFGLERVIKLASNENPLGPSPKALAAVREALNRQHLYPDPSAFELMEVLQQVWKIPKTNLALGNGSDELIDQLCRIYLEPGDGILTSQSAFHAYELSATASRAEVHKTPMTKDFRFDLAAMADFFLAHPEKKIRLIFIANPNNPTGTYAPRGELERFFAKVGNRDDVLLVFDEAYNEFVSAKDYAPAQEFREKVSNLVVLRTFSKAYGLAGFRVGAMIAPAEVIGIYNRVRKPFNINDLAQVAVAAAIQDVEFQEASRQLAWKGLEFFTRKLQNLGLPFLPSQGNFVLFDTLRDAQQVYQALLRKGVILRPVGIYGFPTHLRLSCGLEEENEFAMRALEEVLREIPPKQ